MIVLYYQVKHKQQNVSEHRDIKLKRRLEVAHLVQFIKQETKNHLKLLQLKRSSKIKTIKTDN